MKPALQENMQSSKNLFFGTILSQCMRRYPRKFWNSILPRSEETNIFIMNDEAVGDGTLIFSTFDNDYQSVFSSNDDTVPKFRLDTPLPEL